MEHNHQKPTQQQAEEAVRTLLRWMHENPDAPHLKETPRRLVQSYQHFFCERKETAHTVLQQGLQPARTPGLLVMVPHIPFFSFCEHHIAPITGTVTIGYVPKTHMVGIGHVIKAVELHMRRLMLQEPATQELATLLAEILEPESVGVVVDAIHSCIQMRGEKRQGGPLRTASFLGDFQQKREEFWQLMGL